MGYYGGGGGEEEKRTDKNHDSCEPGSVAAF